MSAIPSSGQYDYHHKYVIPEHSLPEPTAGVLLIVRSLPNGADSDRLGPSLRQRTRPIPLSTSARPTTDSRLFVTNGLPLSPCSILSFGRPRSPTHETLEACINRVFKSQVPPSTQASDRSLDRTSLDTTASAATVQSQSSQTIESEPKGDPQEVERATVIQAIKPRLVRVPSRTVSKHVVREGRPLILNRDSANTHRLESGHSLNKSLPPIPIQEPLSYNALPYQPYCNPFLTVTPDSIGSVTQLSKVYRLATVAGFDLHLPEISSGSRSLKRKPVPGSPLSNVPAPERRDLTITHDSLPYQTYDQPFSSLSPDASDTKQVDHRRIFKKTSGASSGRRRTSTRRSEECNERKRADLSDVHDIISQADDMVTTVKGYIPVAHRRMARKSVVGHSKKLSVRIPVEYRRTVHRKPYRAQIQYKRSTSKVPVGTSTRVKTTALACVPRRLVMLDNDSPVAYPVSKTGALTRHPVSCAVASDTTEAHAFPDGIVRTDKISAKDLAVLPLVGNRDSHGDDSSSAKAHGHEETLASIRERLAALESTLCKAGGEEPEQRQLFAEIEELCGSLGA